MSETLPVRYAMMRTRPKTAPQVGDVFEVYYRVPDPDWHPTNYVYEEALMTVTQVINWGDNSIDVLGNLNNGHPAKYGYQAPSGDLCF
jgi:hypothetical protein